MCHINIFHQRILSVSAFSAEVSGEVHVSFCDTSVQEQLHCDNLPSEQRESEGKLSKLMCSWDE